MKEHNRPFYSCLLSDLASEWQQGWRWPCFDTDLNALVVQIKLFLCQLHDKTKEVCIKERSFKGQVTEQATIKWSINLVRVSEKWCDKNSLEKSLEMILPQQLDKAG